MIKLAQRKQRDTHPDTNTHTLAQCHRDESPPGDNTAETPASVRINALLLTSDSPSELCHTSSLSCLNYSPCFSSHSSNSPLTPPFLPSFPCFRVALSSANLLFSALLLFLPPLLCCFFFLFIFFLLSNHRPHLSLLLLHLPQLWMYMFSSRILVAPFLQYNCCVLSFASPL